MRSGSLGSAPVNLLIAVAGGWAMLRIAFLVIAPAQENLPRPYFEPPELVPPQLVPEMLPADEQFMRLSSAPPRAHLAASVLRRAAPLPLNVQPVTSRALPPRVDQGMGAGMANPQAFRSVQQTLLSRLVSGFDRPNRGAAAALSAGFLRSAPLHESFAPARRPSEQRWTGEAWVFAHGGGMAVASRQPMLGGPQIGTRLVWHGGGAQPDVYVRANSAGRLGRGAEAAIGIAVRPISRLPVTLMAERRQRVAGDGRSAVAAFALVSAQQALPHGWRIDGYGAAGVVSGSAGGGFGEAIVRIDRPLVDAPGALRGGAVLSGSIQRGATRLDVGPSIGMQSSDPASGRGARLSIDWRQRIAGNAAPDSGPAITLSTSF